MLEVRALTLKDAGSKKEPNPYIRVELCVEGSSKYARTHSYNLFKNGGLESAFVGLCEDFGLEEVDELRRLKPEEVFVVKGEVVTEKCKAHYVTDQEGNKIQRDGKDVIATEMTFACPLEWTTKEAIIRSFERSWTKNDLLAEVEDQLNCSDFSEHFNFLASISNL